MIFQFQNIKSILRQKNLNWDSNSRPSKCKANVLTTTPRRQLDHDFQNFFIAFFGHLILIGTKYSYIWSEITSELFVCMTWAGLTGDVNGCVGLADLAHSKTNCRSISWAGLPLSDCLNPGSL